MENNVYNPDVLNCIANLSNDEVFTPPTLANQVLDMLPQELFTNPTTTFLDPFCKSGVFLREIVKRLDHGLSQQIPDRQKRIDHIMHHQVYGMALTELTSMLSRRTLYCSKDANSRHSVSHFDDEQGHVFYKAIKHTWINGKCKYCGASKEVYDRGSEAEQYAYQFIHTDNPQNLFPKNMKFDVIIGNPPYQLSDGGGMGSSAMPIYQKFISQAKKLNPRYLSMIVPSRWFSGGRGLDSFRDEMLHDSQLCEIHDFIDASECFPGVEIKGGVCYFLWKKGNSSNCRIVSHYKNKIEVSQRPLLEDGCESFIRYNSAISILHKVKKQNEQSFSNIVSSNDPFGFDIREANSYKRIKPQFSLNPSADSIKFYYNGWRKDGVGYIPKNCVKKNQDWIKKYKVFVPKAWGNGIAEDDWLAPIIAEPNSCCTVTFLVIGHEDNLNTIENIVSYTQTRFFHFLVSLIKNTQNAMQKVYQFVPLQDFSHPWTDEMLYKKYGLDENEIAFIESMIRPME